jgi:hypothetical protein
MVNRRDSATAALTDIRVSRNIELAWQLNYRIPGVNCMGVTIHYRGQLPHLERIEDFEDRVIDLVLALGGNVQLWRSADDQDPSRMVRGLTVDLAPGQESTSLLISPEGWFVNVFEIEDAEKGLLPEQPWCSVKTQFGPIEGHVALVELLDAIKRHFVPDLEVLDEGGYWEHRDLAGLRQKFGFVQQAIDGLTQAIENDRLSPEAAEDPAILATRVERLARRVHATMTRPSEHAPVRFPDDESGAPADPAENEARWDAMYAENRRKQERMERLIEERLAQGDDTRQALAAAMEEAVPQIDCDDQYESAHRLDGIEEADDHEESWRESSPDGDDEAEEESAWLRETERHPLQQQTKNLYLALHKSFVRRDERSPNVGLLMRSAGEMIGGLAQVLPLPPSYEIDDIEAGHSLVQLKRALRGTAFVRGALFLLRGEEQFDEESFGELVAETDTISSQIVELLRSVRESQEY